MHVSTRQLHSVPRLFDLVVAAIEQLGIRPTRQTGGSGRGEAEGRWERFEKQAAMACRYRALRIRSSHSHDADRMSGHRVPFVCVQL